MSSSNHFAGQTRRQSIAQRLLQQFRFPTFARALVECLMLSAVFLAAGNISLGLGFVEMLPPMVPVVLVIMFCMIASGVYRTEIMHSIIDLYAHSAYGFVLSTFAFILTVALLLPQYTDSKFIFFFLFFLFFVTNTIRPLISGTNFMDGGGRRGN
ncbi:MAG: hypothetical protein KAG66_24890 [Methylococcales bacterium]|nr:hypothetical protein [Methylococcales bacterium]